jgi:hypothetical protein
MKISIKTMMRVGAAALIITTPALAGRAALAANLVIDGKVASTSVRTINGAAYVKVADVAKALGMVVVKRADGYEIAKAGGANQINGLMQGKIGDQLFDGKWRFKVTGTETASTYAMKTQGDPYAVSDEADYNSVTHVIAAKNGSTLVIVHCVVVNGQKTTQTLWTAAQGSNTALTDDQGHSFPPSAHDFTGAPIQTQPLLPGAKIEFPVVFCVPQGTNLKDLVFTLRNNDSSSKGDDVRVSLKQN